MKLSFQTLVVLCFVMISLFAQSGAGEHGGFSLDPATIVNSLKGLLTLGGGKLPEAAENTVITMAVTAIEYGIEHVCSNATFATLKPLIRPAITLGLKVVKAIITITMTNVSSIGGSSTTTASPQIRDVRALRDVRERFAY